jgi:hypothetical protein
MLALVSEKFDVRADTGMRLLAVGGIAMECVFMWIFWKAGWAGPNIVFFVAIPVLALMAAGVWSWPSSIDASGNLRIKGPTQGRIPLNSITSIRREGDLVLIDWQDSGRARVKRVLPKEPAHFVAWVRARSEAARGGAA